MKKVVLATGVFDIVHPGHIFYLSEAKKLGDELIVLVSSDKVATKQKRKPNFSQMDRKLLIESLRMVDKVVVGLEMLDYKKTVKEIKPDIIALGFDQKITPADLKNALGKSYTGQIIRLEQGYSVNKSTTSIIENIINNFGDK